MEKPGKYHLSITNRKEILRLLSLFPHFYDIMVLIIILFHKMITIGAK